MATIILSFIALSISMIVKYGTGVSVIEAFALFFGLEGTVLLASALSPPRDHMAKSNKKGVINWLKWWHEEGKGYAYPFHYNPVCFYAGLMFLAISMTLSAISSSSLLG